MQAAEFHQSYADERALFVRRWLPEGAVRGALIVVHGMSEHSRRYERFAQAATARGLAVYAMDLPGHGNTARSEAERGHFADRNGWTVALAAIASTRARVQAEQAGVPLVIFGHSMGSFLLQHYLHAHAAGLAGAILCGTTGDLSPVRALGVQLMRLESLIFGVRHKSALAGALSFKQFARAIPNRRTEFDWLSRDAAEVDRYIGDPWCGHRCSAALWEELLAAGAYLTETSRLRAIPRDLPILLVSGSDDPACQGAKGPQVLADAYRAVGIADVTVTIYPGARHELLNETNRDGVTADLLAWIDRHLVKSKA